MKENGMENGRRICVWEEASSWQRRRGQQRNSTPAISDAVSKDISGAVDAAINRAATTADNGRADADFARLPVIQSDELQCEWLTWTAINPSWLHLYLPEGNCTHQPGATALGERLLPEVTCIDVFQNGVPDSRYVKKPSGEWEWRPYDARTAHRLAELSIIRLEAQVAWFKRYLGAMG